MASEKRFFKALVLLILFQLCSSANIVTDGQILVSNGETFALGFFSPGNSKNRYVGIWYNKVPKQTVVWVANRDNPVPDSTGVLTIAGDGNLAVFHGDRKSPLWSTDVSTATTNSTVKLLDSGNLLLYNAPSKRVIWQSFDYPTDAFLPGMKLGLNRKTGLNWTVTSWKSRDDPGRGDYSIRLDPRGSPQFFYYKGSVPYRRSGPWNGRELSGVPEMPHIHMLRYVFVNNDDEISLMYIMENSSILSRIVLGESGFVKRMTWRDGNHGWNLFVSAPTDRCDYYGHCGVYGSCNHNQVVECECLPGFQPKSPRDWFVRDWAGGCVRKRALECRTGEGFLKLAHLKVPDASISRVDMNLSLKECEKECLRNCSCTGYSSANISGGGSGCIAWYGDLMDIREFTNEGQDFYLRVDAVELAQARRESKGFLGRERMALILTVSIDGGILFLVACGYYTLKKRKRREKTEKRRHRERILHNLTSSSITSRDSSSANEVDYSRTSLELPFFELDVIIAATNHFSSSNMIGQGGFGSVYKGQISNGQEIAVKRLSKNSRQGIEEFRNEIMLIAKLQHRNLVRLTGYCIQAEEAMLIYEYLPNKSLDTFIFDQSGRALLDWRKRFEIIVGIARGILYLHQDSRFRVIHRDLKASNILLDAELNPKISDFGMARIFGGNQIQAKTSKVVGTYGYMSPEYAMQGLFSIKSDVFSFGVLLMEIISGTKNNNCYPEDPALNLLGHAWNLWREGRVLEIVDSSMDDSCPIHEVLRCIHVGFLCVQERASDRPTMSSVVFMLTNETSLPPPNQPAFVIREILEDKHPNSMNDLTITVAEAR